jgi:hypothetical protein
MGQRQKLHNILLGLTPNVYFQPPESVKMQYPCIVYQRDYADADFAGNKTYRYTQRYQVTVIDESADSAILPGVVALPMSTYLRGFASDNLNHDIVRVYF